MIPLENFLKMRKLMLFRRIGISPDDDMSMYDTTPHMQCIKTLPYPADAYLPPALVQCINIYQVVSVDNDELMQLVYYHDTKHFVPPVSLGKADIRKIAQRLPEYNGKLLIYLMVPMSTQAAVLAVTFGFEVVQIDLFRFLRTMSRMVPTYRIIDDETSLLTRLKCMRTNLPRILLSDPIVCIYGWKKDMIVYAVESDIYRLIC